MTHETSGFACSPLLLVLPVLAVTACGGGGETTPSTNGSVEVTLSVSGDEQDENGCLVSLDDGTARRLEPGKTIQFASVRAGTHSLGVNDVASNCVLAGDNPREVAVNGSKTTEVALEMTCSPILTTLDLSKITIGVVPEGSESLEVTALDEEGLPDSWSAEVEDETLVTIEQDDSTLTITGVEVGDTTVRITSEAGLERELPIRVYDPMVLDTGELLVRYVDEFSWRWDDSGSGAPDDGGFWHPVTPTGWHALGSLGVQGYASPNQNYWMILVKEDGDVGALSEPLDYYREYDDSGSGATDDGSFWTPVCPEGFVALGAVAQAGYAKPSLGDVACVREDLTVPGMAGPWIWDDSGTGAGDYIGMWRIDIPEREDQADTRLYLAPGTFVGTGSEGGICSGDACWSAPAAYPQMNVLAVDTTMLFDTETSAWTPRLKSYEEPAGSTEPFVAKAMLVPFTAVLSGSEIAGRIHEYVSESPFLRFEKNMQFHRLGWMFCGGSTTCELEYAVEKGVETTTSETFSHTVGISITAESGVSFLGAGGKMSVTVNYEFGYSTTESRAVLVSESWTASKPCPAESACAIWTDHTAFVVKKRLPSGNLAVVDGGQLSFDGGLSIWADEYKAE